MSQYQISDAPIFSQRRENERRGERANGATHRRAWCAVVGVWDRESAFPFAAWPGAQVPSYNIACVCIYVCAYVCVDVRKSVSVYVSVSVSVSFCSAIRVLVWESAFVVSAWAGAQVSCFVHIHIRVSIFISVYVSWSVFVREGGCVCLCLCISVQLLVSETENQRFLYGVVGFLKL